MNKHILRHAGARQGGTARSRSDVGYRVGYGKPPQEHRFRPGQCGNRKGRPKGSKNNATLLRQILDRKIPIRRGNSVRRISVREAILTRFAESALKGDTKAAAFLLQRYDMAETAQEDANNLTTLEEREIIDTYMKIYLRDRR